MSLFGSLFNSSDSKVTSSGNVQWNDLTEIKQLDEIAESSVETPVIIFKHSTRCSISRMALKQFEREYNIEEGKAKPYFLDLLEHRDISNEIASRFTVQHQSPQLILIKNGKAVYNASHQDIDAGVVKGKV
jgi:bacillithiol system protein YtxJ